MRALLVFLLCIGSAYGSPAIVTLYGKVNQAAAHDVITQIQAANRDPKERDPIILYIYSPGGEMLAGAAIIDAMDASRRPVWTVDAGIAASMAAIIHSYGVKRFMLPHAVLMHHESESGAGGSPAQMAAQVGVISRMVEGFEKHVASVAHITLAEFRAKESANWWMLADEAVKAHLADKIVNPVDYPAPMPPPEDKHG